MAEFYKFQQEMQPARRRDTVPMRDDLCTPCGQPRDAHFTAGNRKRDCAYALASVARAKADSGPVCDQCGRGFRGQGAILLMGVGAFCSDRCATTGSRGGCVLGRGCRSAR